MDKKIVMVRWDENGHTNQLNFDLSRPIIIGRQPESDIVLADSKVSRRHASLYIKNGQLYVANLSQTNKVHILRSGHTQSIGYEKEAALDDETHFQISKTVFQVIAQATEKPKTPAKQQKDDELKIVCPTCGRAIPASLRDCPYDGASLANGQTFVLKADDLESLI